MSRRIGSIMKYAAAMAVALAFGAALADHPLSDPNAAKLNGGLANSRAVFETTKKGTVAFLGGSITQRADDWYWRPIIQRSLTNRFPHTTFKFTGAGISSTGSLIGSFRLKSDVLNHANGTPDLLFVEFAVNDNRYWGKTEGSATVAQMKRWLEGIVRQARRANPKMDIVLISFVDTGWYETIAGGGEPNPCKAHREVAEYYGLPYAYIGAELVARTKAGKFDGWRGYGNDCHSNGPGMRLVADVVENLLDQADFGEAFSGGAAADKVLPAAIDSFCYERPTYLSIPRYVSKSGHWFSLSYSPYPSLCSTNAASSLTISFSGTAVGFRGAVGVIGPKVDVSVDGGAPVRMDLYNYQSWLYGRDMYDIVMIADGLSDTNHVVTMSLPPASEVPQSSYGMDVKKEIHLYIQDICVNGSAPAVSMRVPEGYTRLEYVDSTGNAYVDTLYVASPQTVAEFKGSFRTRHISYNRLFASYVNEATDAFRVIASQASSSSLIVNCCSLAGGGGVGVNNVTTAIGQDIEGWFSSSGGWINGKKVGAVTTRGDANTSTVQLFDSHPGHVGSEVRLNYVRFRENAVLVKNFIPCRRDSDNAVGFYENVQGRFYAKASAAGTLTAGPVVESGSGAEVVAKSLSVADIAEQVYRGAAVTPAVAVTDSSTGAALTLNVDYTVAYANNNGVGTGTATVTGKGAYAGSSVVKTFSIVADAGAPKTFLAVDIGDQVYTGSPVIPDPGPAATDSETGAALVYGTDFTVSYANNTAVGIATATFTGINAYAGCVQEKTFRIVAAVVEGPCTVEDWSKVVPYSYIDSDCATVSTHYVPNTSTHIEFKAAFLNENGSYTALFAMPHKSEDHDILRVISKGADYNSLYVNCCSRTGDAMGFDNVTKNIGDVIEGWFSYSSGGQINGVEREAKMIRGTASSDYVDLHNTSTRTRIYYFRVKEDGVLLKSFVPCTYAGVPGYCETVNGMFYPQTAGDGSLTACVEVPKFAVNAIEGRFYADAGGVEPTVTAYDIFTLKQLKEGVDFDVVYSNNTAPGTGVATLTGKGSYSGTVTATFTIVPNLTVADIAEQVYRGAAVTPAVVVTDSSTGEELTLNEDYTVAYANNNGVGTGTATVTGIGVYDGCVQEKTFRIVEAVAAGPCTVEDWSKVVPYSYIDSDCANVSTLYVPTPSTHIEFKAAFLNADGSWKALFAAFESDNHDSLRVISKNADYNSLLVNGCSRGNAGVYVDNVTTAIGQPIEGWFSSSGGEINGKKVGATPTRGTESSQYINLHNLSTQTRIYYFRVKEGGVLLKSFVPCTYDGVPGYCETVNGMFYPKTDGSGSLTACVKVPKFAVNAIEGRFYADAGGVAPPVTAYDIFTLKQLEKGVDFDVVYSNNTAPGTGVATLTGKGSYSGTVTVTFTIVPNLTVADIAEQVYRGAAVTPAVVVTDSSTGEELTLNEDYTVAYANNNGVGTGTATVTGKGDYDGCVQEKTFRIVEAVAARSLSVADIAEQVYRGAAVTPAVVVTDSETGAALTLNEDYTVAYANNNGVGTGTATVTGINAYAGSSVVKTFSIVAEVAARGLSVADIAEQVYRGAAVTPAVVVTDSETGAALTLNEDYTVAYANNNGVGTGTATVTGIGAYDGSSVVKTFSIVEAVAAGPCTVEDWSKVVPYSYIDSDCATVNTLYVPTNTSTHIEFKAAFLNKNGEYKALFSTPYKDENTDILRVISIGANYNSLYVNCGSQARSSMVFNNVTTDIGQDIEGWFSYSSGGKINGVEAGPNKTRGTASSQSVDLHNTSTKTRIYYFRVKEGGVLLKSFVPCTYDGVPGYCETVNGMFYPQTAGSGSLKACVEVPKFAANAIEGRFYANAGGVKPPVTAYDIFTLKPLEEGVDFDVAYSNNNAPGTGVATLTGKGGKGSYSGTVTATFTIVPNLTIDEVSYQIYDGGTAIEPVAVVRDAVTGEVLEKDVDYTISYANNTGVGTATVTATGDGTTYLGSVSTGFQILPVYCVTPDATGGRNGLAWTDGAGDEGPMTIDEAYGAYTNGGYRACAILLKTGTYAPATRLWVRSTFVMSGGLAGVDNHTKSAPDAKSVLDGRGVVDLVNVERIPDADTAYFRGIEFRRAYSTALRKTDVKYDGVNYSGGVDVDGCRFADNAPDYSTADTGYAYASAIAAFIDGGEARKSKFRCANTLFDGNVTTNTSGTAGWYWGSTMVVNIKEIGSAEFVGCQFVTNGIPFTQKLGVPPSGAPRHSPFAASLVDFNDMASLTVRDCEFRGNRTHAISQNGYYQPMVYARRVGAPESWQCAFTNCLFVGNEVTHATALNLSTVFINNWGILCIDGGRIAANPAEVVNCTFAYNIVNTINSTAGLCLNNGRLKLRNSILYSNRRMPKTTFQDDLVTGSDFYVVGYGRADVDYTLFTSLDATNVSGSALSVISLGEHVYTGSPRFVSGVDDFAALISSTSETVKETIGFTPNDETMAAVLALDVHTTGQMYPMVDGGDYETPVGAEPSPNGGRVNLGYYGGTAEAETTPAGGQPEFSGGIAVTFPYESGQPHLAFEVGGTGNFIANASVFWSTNGVDFVHYKDFDGIVNGSRFDQDLFLMFDRYQSLSIRVQLHSNGSQGQEATSVQDVPYDRDPTFGHGGGAGIVHVRVGAHGDGSGSDWFNAIADINSALDRFRQGEIWFSGEFTLGESIQNVETTGALTLRGGFDGSEDSAAERAKGARTTIDGQRIYKTFEFSSAAGNPVTIEGFLLRQSLLQAIRKTGAGDIVVRDCDFYSNNWNGSGEYTDSSQGSAAYIVGSAGTTVATVTNCVVAGGRHVGGGINDNRYISRMGLYFQDLGRAHVDGCLFLTNGVAPGAADLVAAVASQSAGGVAIAAVAAPLTARNCEFRGNRAQAWSSGGNYANGGIVSLTGNGGGSAFTNCLFVANSLEQSYVQSGATNAYSGMVMANFDTAARTVDFVNCTFAGNLVDTPSSPAGVNIANGTASIANCVFDCNYTSRHRLSDTVGNDVRAGGSSAVTVDWTAFDRELEDAVAGEASATVAVGQNNLAGVRCVAIDATAYAANIVAHPNANIKLADPIRFDPATSASRIAAANGHLFGGRGYYDERTGELVTGFIRLGKSAALDAGDPAAAYSREPDCQQGWHGKRLNLGAYGNTPWATMTVYPGGMVILR